LLLPLLASNSGRCQHRPGARHVAHEYPEDWEALLDIDGTGGLAALIDGVDKFAADSNAAGDAVESLLEG
jgi:hypothetical protein